MDDRLLLDSGGSWFLRRSLAPTPSDRGALWLPWRRLSTCWVSAAIFEPASFTLRCTPSSASAEAFTFTIYLSRVARSSFSQIAKGMQIFDRFTLRIEGCVARTRRRMPHERRATWLELGRHVLPCRQCRSPRTHDQNAVFFFGLKVEQEKNGVFGFRCSVSDFVRLEGFPYSTFCWTRPQQPTHGDCSSSQPVGSGQKNNFLICSGSTRRPTNLFDEEKVAYVRMLSVPVYLNVATSRSTHSMASV